MVARVKGSDAPSLTAAGRLMWSQPRPCLGNCAGGAVRLVEAEGPSWWLQEGIETGLSLASGLLPMPVTIWAAPVQFPPDRRSAAPQQQADRLSLTVADAFRNIHAPFGSLEPKVPLEEIFDTY